VRKGHKVSGSGTAKDGIGMKGEQLVHVQFPEFIFWGMMTLEDDDIIVADGDGGGSEGNIASSITQLANGEEQLHGKVGDDVPMMQSSQ